MNQASPLIAISNSPINGGVTQTVNARELHAFLGSKRQFADWINERIQKYGFVENQDFVIASQNCDAKSPGQRGGHNKKEFFLTLDMAKELAMVENNDKGREARRYFIECERRVKEALACQTVLVSVAAPYISALGNQRMTQATEDELLRVIGCKAEAVGRALADAYFAELLSQVKLRGGLQPDDRLTRFSELEGQRAINMVERSEGVKITLTGNQVSAVSVGNNQIAAVRQQLTHKNGVWPEQHPSQWRLPDVVARARVAGVLPPS